MAKTITVTIHRPRKPPDPPQTRRSAAGVAWVSPWDRKVLLLLRAEGGPHPGTWCFPAGKVEPGESTVAGAIREFREETGCWNSPRAANVAPIWQSSTFALYLYAGSKFGPIIDGESDDFLWADIDNPPKPLHPFVQEQLDTIKAALEPFDLATRGRT